MNYRNIISIMFAFLTITGCKKAVEVGVPTTNLVSASVFNNNSTASAAVTGIYSRMMSNGGLFAYGRISIGTFGAISADELSLYPNPGNVQLAQAYTNSLVSNTTTPVPFWASLYNYIYLANSAIEGLTSSKGVTEPVKSQLVGECKFMRALCHFYLVNYYGDVPIATSTDFQKNSLLARSPSVKVYEQIIADLREAQNLLSANFLDATGNITTERSRPNKWAAQALLARAYLYYANLTNDNNSYIQADSAATSVINNGSLFSLESLNNVFLKNSNEAIWQLQPVQENSTSLDGVFYILTSGPNPQSKPFYLSPQLLNAFESGDQRRNYWVGVDSTTGVKYYYPFKYKTKTVSISSLTEYLMVLRLAEQYLIRSEARAQDGNLNGAIDDLNKIRNRAGLPNTTALTQTETLSAILRERQVELFTEWGHRWLDLKRTNTINTVMDVVTPLKGGTWSASKQLFPIPFSDIQADPNLTQNPGYN